MTIASNLYASRVFSEHPTASWPLDDDVSYISLITEEDRSFSTWTLSASTGYSDLIPDSTDDFFPGPFIDSEYSQLTSSASYTVPIQAFSASVFNLQDLNKKINTFAINLYLFTLNSVSYYEYGYRYYDSSLSAWVEDTKTAPGQFAGTWVRLGSTFNPPNINAPVQIVLRVYFSTGTNPSIIMNGLSVGQRSETTSAKTLGVIPELLKEELQLIFDNETITGVPVQAYAISEDDGYILVEDNALLAVNHGVPMAFGSDNITKLYPSASALPSVIMPSKGLLNEKNQYGTYTVEMWLRIENNYPYARRIWGPLKSDYGLYVKRGYLSLVIGDAIGSYFVADWYRPMLVHIVIRENNAMLFINGEQVVSIDYKTSELILPESNEDWMGFYCYDNMPIFEIDCVSILPYVISENIAKRRFVWGQGVDNPEDINVAYEGVVSYVDYPFAEYTSNFTYPDRGNWEAGYFENLNATRRSISVPNYDLPQIQIGQKTIKDFYDDNKIKNAIEYPSASAIVVSASAGSGVITYTTSASHSFELSDRVTILGADIKNFDITSSITSISASNSFTVLGNASGSSSFTNGKALRNHAKFTTFRPNNTWTDPSYYLFNSLNVINDTVRGIWGIFEVESSSSSAQPLMHFHNKISGDYIKIDISGYTVSYKIYKQGALYSTPYTFTVQPNEHFVVGFHLPKLFEKMGSVIGEFFGNPSAVEIYVGGDGTTTFEGLIYRVGFSNQTNLDLIDNHFYMSGQYQGMAIPTDGDLLNYHLGSYVLLPLEEFNRFYLDVGVSSYWEEYYPLSMFATYIQDKNGNQIYDLDFLQYNIGYPTTISLVENTTVGSWLYQELFDEYSSPIAKTYEALDNSLITGYSNYSDLKNKLITTKEYDFSKSSVRSYITFQKISNGANKSLFDYSISESIPANGVLDVPLYSNQFSTKFEIKDQSIIYPSRIFDINETAIAVHLEINIEGVKTNPLNIRKMSLISKSLSENDFSHIGTRFGTRMYPYTKIGFYYDYKQKNPYSIYKESTPYLYLTKNSGIEVLSNKEYGVEKGMYIPINENQVAEESISSIQLWIKYSNEDFPQVGTTLFSIDSRIFTLGFKIISDPSTQRGKLYAVNLNNNVDYTSLTFYQDGVQVIAPYLEKNKWTVIGVSFTNPIDFSSYTGSINLFSLATFNNISYYRSTALQEAKSIIYRRWDDIKGSPASPLDWKYWKEDISPTTWDNVLKLAETGSYGINPSQLFKVYTGTNREIVDDESILLVQDNGVTMFMGAEWSTYNQKPV